MLLFLPGRLYYCTLLVADNVAKFFTYIETHILCDLTVAPCCLACGFTLDCLLLFFPPLLRPSFCPHLHLHVTARSASFVASRDIVYATSIPHSNRTKILQGCWHLKPGSACGQNVLESDLPASSLHTSADFLLKQWLPRRRRLGRQYSSRSPMRLRDTIRGADRSPCAYEPSARATIAVLASTILLRTSVCTPGTNPRPAPSRMLH